MSRRIALLALAHGRSGDKGDAVNIGVIARDPRWYEFLRSELDTYKVARFLRHMADGPVTRYELPNLHALNFLVDGALAGGGSVGLKIDAQGKTYAHALLRYPVDVPNDLFAEIEEHFGGDIPRECFYYATQPVVKGEELVLSEEDDRVRSIRLNRPALRNALTVPMMQEVDRLVRQATGMPGARDKVVVLSGEGPSFCAGMDLKALRALKRDYVAYRGVAESLYAMLAALIESPLPVVCAVKGDAMGGGAALMLASDIVVANESARIAMPETRIGFIPAMVSVLAMRRMPPSAARELLISGRSISARDAHSLGIVHHLVDGDPVAYATVLAQRLVAENSHDAMARTKDLLRITSEATLLNDLRLTIGFFAGAATRASFDSGMEAFAKKQALDWSHDLRE
ncbi:MAG: enoyl-CoA hydratase/isomerase family protein [Candidatus Sumerlaeia bacterium]|nr:enoyl-CoA hydratase/isomerase family protein [Candidatus Sumerlaeia bacterium]